MLSTKRLVTFAILMTTQLSMAMPAARFVSNIFCSGHGVTAVLKELTLTRLGSTATLVVTAGQSQRIFKVGSSSNLTAMDTLKPGKFSVIASLSLDPKDTVNLALTSLNDRSGRIQAQIIVPSMSISLEAPNVLECKDNRFGGPVPSHL